MEEDIHKLMKTNTAIHKSGYELASIIWSANNLVELNYLVRTIDSILPKKYEQLQTLKNIKDQVGLK